MRKRSIKKLLITLCIGLMVPALLLTGYSGFTDFFPTLTDTRQDVRGNMYTAVSSGEVRAFPGAEGYGAKTRGAFGSSGQSVSILQVTNLNDSGAGSLRNALEHNGPRVVIFKTGGTIRLSKDINIFNPYLTVAGQTAPGDGIAIRNGSLRVKTHDIIIRGLRWRSGRGRNISDNEDCISIENGSAQPYNIIVDHNSLTWASDEIAVSWFPAHNITWQWNIIAEGLMDYGGHGYGLLAGTSSKEISIHHNLFAHLKMRMPECNGDSSGEIINNVMYHWTNKATDFIDVQPVRPSFWNVIKNYYKRKGGDGPELPIFIYNYPGWNHELYIDSASRFYLEGNYSNSAGNNNDWGLVNYVGGQAKNQFWAASFAVNPSGIQEQSPEEAYGLVLGNAGARTPSLDDVDSRIIAEVQNETGDLINAVSDGDYPALSRGTPQKDSDNDGLPDGFEAVNGRGNTSLDPLDTAPDGYHWIEAYINSLISMP